MQKEDKGIIIKGMPVYVATGKEEYAEARQVRQAVRGVTTVTTPLTGASISANAYGKDEFHYVTPAGTLAALTLVLPAVTVADEDWTIGERPAEDGQVISLLSTQTLTSLTITAGTGTTIGGAALTAGVTNTTYRWMYVAASAMWIRL
jgi:hypothetical protein